MWQSDVLTKNTCFGTGRRPFSLCRFARPTVKRPVDTGKRLDRAGLDFKLLEHAQAIVSRIAGDRKGRKKSRRLRTVFILMTASKFPTRQENVH
jgi:hypothetical protein